MPSQFNLCGGSDHFTFTRRTLLAAAGVSGLSWLTPLATQLARAQEAAPRGAPPKSVIFLWMQGGPSQLETFDPHPGTDIAGGSRAIDTAVKGVQLGDGLPQLAEEMASVALVRSIVSKEGDHERATYNLKTGFRPDPTLVHPAIGGVLCHQLDEAGCEIPRHVSIFPNQWAGRGGYLGDQFDSFRIDDPVNPIPDVTPRVSQDRFDRRVTKLPVVESEFARGRLKQLDGGKTLHLLSSKAALRMMTSDQLKAFNVREEPQSVREAFGDTPFGRGCLAAARLIGVGVRCVEVTLNGWDTHANNHEGHRTQNKILDPAFTALIRELKRRELWEQTIVLCGGEFGRTPKINGRKGRDHWPHGFSFALAGGCLRGGVVVGETSPEPTLDEKPREQDVAHPVSPADIHATVLKAFGIEYAKELITPIGRPMKISEGKPIAELLMS